MPIPESETDNIITFLTCLYSSFDILHSIEILP